MYYRILLPKIISKYFLVISNLLVSRVQEI